MSSDIVAWFELATAADGEVSLSLLLSLQPPPNVLKYGRQQAFQLSLFLDCVVWAHMPLRLLRLIDVDRGVHTITANSHFVCLMMVVVELACA